MNLQNFCKFYEIFHERRIFSYGIAIHCKNATPFCTIFRSGSIGRVAYKRAVTREKRSVCCDWSWGEFECACVTSATYKSIVVHECDIWFSLCVKFPISNFQFSWKKNCSRNWLKVTKRKVCDRYKDQFVSNFSLLTTKKLSTTTTTTMDNIEHLYKCYEILSESGDKIGEVSSQLQYPFI